MRAFTWMMIMSEHTKGPWHVDEGTLSGPVMIKSRHHNTVAVMKTSTRRVGINAVEAAANAEHIVICVNERQVLLDRIAELENEIEALKCNAE
jgi:hypothetical protein